jgi:hypothetical protein
MAVTLDTVKTALAVFEPFSPALKFLLLLTLFLTLRCVSKITHFIFVYFLRPGKNLRKYGKWASKYHIQNELKVITIIFIL